MHSRPPIPPPPPRDLPPTPSSYPLYILPPPQERKHELASIRTRGPLRLHLPPPPPSYSPPHPRLRPTRRKLMAHNGLDRGTGLGVIGANHPVQVKSMPGLSSLLPPPSPPLRIRPLGPRAPPRPSVPHNSINVGSGGEIIGTKRQSQSLRARALVRACAFVHALKLAYPKLSRMQEACALMQEARALTHKRALALPQEVRTPVPPRMQAFPQKQHFNTTEVLADSDIKDILYTISPDRRYELARRLWLHSPQTRHEHVWLFDLIAPITRLPPELLQLILLIVIDEVSNSPSVLVHVSKYWYNMVTGIWASLKLGTRTPKDTVTAKLGRNQWFLDILVDTEIDRSDLAPSEGAYEAIFAAIEAASRWRSVVVETFPGQAELPEDLVKYRLKQYYNASMRHLKTFRIKRACELSPLLHHLLSILGTTASAELTEVEINSANVISFLLAPVYSSIFNSIKVLCLDIPGADNPIDLLPCLYQLEALTISHLSLPIYRPDVKLPLVHTLRHLRLRAASVQWMSSRTFHVLESCTIIFPRHHHALHISRTTLPNC